MDKMVFVGGYRRVEAGRFSRMFVLGTADFAADVQGANAWILGTCSFWRNMMLRNVIALGTITVNGEARLKKLVNPGTFITHGNVHIRKLMNKGTFQCKGSYEGGKLKSVGTVHTGADMRLDSFQSRGTFHIGGKLSATSIQARISGLCSAAEIHAHLIHIQVAGKKGARRLLTAGRIHADKLYIEHTNVKLITGADITIGPSCAVDMIYYSDRLTVHPSSSVRYSEKS